MGGKRRAQPSGNAKGEAAANGDGAAAHEGPSRKRQTRGLSVHGSAAGPAEGDSCGPEVSVSTLSFPVAMCLAWRCDPTALAGRKAALEAALMEVVAAFGGRDCRVEWTKVGPSEDTLQQVLPLVLERLEPEGAAQCYFVCRAFRSELEARGFCSKTVQLCSALAKSGDARRLRLQVLRQNASYAGAASSERGFRVDAFLKKMQGWKGSLQEWLQAASQEPDASFLSRGAAATAQGLGLPLVRWVGKPQGGYTNTLPNSESSWVTSLEFSGDGTCVVSGSSDRLVKIWDVATGAEVCTMTGHSGGLLCVSFSRDGKRVVSGSQDSTAKIWNAETGAEVRTLTGHAGAVHSVAFSRDETRVVSGSRDSTVKIWNAETGAEVWTLAGHSKGVLSVDFSPDGKRVVSGSFDNLVKIWSADTGAQMWTSESHSATGRCICTFEVDEYWDGDLNVNPECPVTGHSDMVTRVQFSNDGAQAISISADETVRFWDAASGRQVRQLAGTGFESHRDLSDAGNRGRHALSLRDDTLGIYRGGTERQRAACFKAPDRINTVRCYGAAICVGCTNGGAVCILSAPFLAA